MAAERNVDIRDAVDKLYELSADKQVRAEYEMRQKAWRDRMSQYDGYYQDGRQEGIVEAKEQAYREKLAGARKLKQMGVSPGIIAESLGLPPEKTAKL